MNNLSVIIPSRNASNFVKCAAAVREHQPSLRIILVGDGVNLMPDTQKQLEPCVSIKTGQPFIFSRNVNAGIMAAGSDDVIVLNDDALLRTPGGFVTLQCAAEENPQYGLIAAVTNNVGNRNQFPQKVGLREEPRMVCFVCVLIPRRTIERVGLLDEIYVAYGLEDDDYCLRVRQAGLKIGIHDDCFVDHASLPSSFRGPAGAGGNFLPNLEVFRDKWGMDNYGRPA